MENKKLFRGYAFVVLSALIFGLMPLMAKFIYADGVNSITLVFLRNFLSLPVLALLAFCGEGKIKLSVKELPKISFIAIMGCCMTPLLLFSSYNYIPSGTATVFHFIYPAVVVIGEFLFMKNKINYGHVISVIICMVGVALFYDPSTGIDLRGSFYALASGITYAIYIIALSGFRREGRSAFGFCFCVSAIASVVMFCVCVFTGQLALPRSLLGWVLAIFFAFSVNAGAVALFQRGTFIIGGSRASILSTFEPITSIFAGIIIFREKTSVFMIVGAVLVISASVLIALFDVKKTKKEK